MAVSSSFLPTSRRASLAVATIIWAGLVSQPTAAGNLSLDALRAEVRAAAELRFPEIPLDDGRDAQEFRSGEATIYIGNLYATVRDFPAADRAVEIAKWLASINAIARKEPAEPEDWNAARPLLRPKLVSVNIEHMKLMLSRPFSRGAAIVYGIDLGTRDAYVFEKKVAEWGIAPETLHDVAIANLEAMSTEIKLEPHVTDTGRCITVATGDAYDATRLLLPAFRSRLLSNLAPSILVGVPDRDFLVAWTKNISGQDWLVEQIRKDAVSRPRPLTDEIFVVTAEGVRLATANDLR